MSLQSRVERLEGATCEVSELVDLSGLSDEELRRIVEASGLSEDKLTHMFDDLTDAELGRLELLTRKRQAGLSVDERFEFEHLAGKVKTL